MFEVERAKFIYWNLDKMITEHCLPKQDKGIWEVYYKLSNLFCLIFRNGGGVTAEEAIDYLLKFSFKLREEYAVYYFNASDKEKLTFEQWVHKNAKH